LTTWEKFVARRKINTDLFLSRNSIKTREEFVIHLLARSIEPPDEQTLSAMFPQPVQQQAESQNSELAEEPQQVIATSTRRQSNTQNKKR